VLAARLAAFWLPGQRVLYIGRTAKSLGPRVAAMLATPLGDRRPHPDGNWLRTLLRPALLRIWWAETTAPEEYQDGLAMLFAESVDLASAPGLPDTSIILPWANLDAVTGERKATGIEGALLPEATTRAASSTIVRSSETAGDNATPLEAGAATTSAAATGSPAAPGPSVSRPAASTSAPVAGTKATARKAPTSGSPPRAPSQTPGSPPRRRAAGTASSKPQPEKTHVTAQGLRSLESELTELVTVSRPEVIARVKNARELGDLRENADYEAARNEQSFVEGRIRSLEELIKHAQVISGDHTGEVILGSTVLVDLDGEQTTFHIVGSTEADPAAGRISNVSPVGRALIGHRAGEKVTAELPGRHVVYHIIEVH